MKSSLTIIARAVADLAPYARNARLHSPEQVAQIAASIREFGFNVPVLLDAKDSIVAGHGRVLAAQSLGLAEVPTICLGHLSDQQVRAYRLADNRIALSAKWDDALLSLEMVDLRDAGVDLALLGFDDKEVNRLLTGSGDPAEDETPPVPEHPVSRPGDVWVLGAHRIICGDATDATVVARLLGDEKPSLMVTDPPYGVEYDPAWRNRAGLGATQRTGRVENDDRADWREAWALFPGDAVYIWHGALHAPTVAESMVACGFEIRAQIIWAKDRLVLSRGHYHWQHEPCWYGVRKGRPGGWHGDRKQTTLWSISGGAEDAATVHGTQKPVECMRRPMVNSSMPGEIIYEPFSGSGTTLIAAESSGRRCFAIELNPAYVDVAVLRWQAYANGEARLLDDGRAFPEIAKARAAPIFG